MTGEKFDRFPRGEKVGGRLRDRFGDQLYARAATRDRARSFSASVGARKNIIGRTVIAFFVPGYRGPLVTQRTGSEIGFKLYRSVVGRAWPIRQRCLRS